METSRGGRKPVLILRRLALIEDENRARAERGGANPARFGAASPAEKAHRQTGGARAGLYASRSIVAGSILLLCQHDPILPFVAADFCRRLFLPLCIGGRGSGCEAAPRSG